jgi:hypothetical protein
MKFKNSMLAYCKQILGIVSFNRTLFKKEYKKSVKWLSPTEVAELKLWIRKTIV